MSIIVPDKFSHFIAKHCETGSLKRVLDYHGLHLSEEMLFGLGGGIGFIYWNTKQMPYPFIGSRFGKVAEFPQSICNRIGAMADIIGTSSTQKAYKELKHYLENNEPVVLYVDMAYLTYLSNPETAHFGGHAIVVYGLDELSDTAYIYDRALKPVTCSISNLTKARASGYPPFPAKNRYLKISYPSRIKNLQSGIVESIKECCRGMLMLPINNFGLKGMKKWADMVNKWPQMYDNSQLLGTLMSAFIYIEIGGTGGSAFRPMYARFLKESSAILKIKELNEIADMFSESAKIWTDIAGLFLPDSYSGLRAIRELVYSKNAIFEQQEPDTIIKMEQINHKMEENIRLAITEVKHAPEFLKLVSDRILNCRDIELKAFQSLAKIIV